MTNIQPECAASSSVLASEMCSLQHMQGLEWKQLGRKHLAVPLISQIQLMSSVVLNHTSLGQTRSMWLGNECEADCSVVETCQAGVSESKDTVLTEARINYFHHCLKPDDTSATISSCAPHCQQQGKTRASSDPHGLGLLPFRTLTGISLTLGLSLPLCGMSPCASSSFKPPLLVVLHCFFETTAGCHLPGLHCF